VCYLTPSAIRSTQKGEGLLVQANIKNLPIADDSIDMIFTDPPYPKDSLPCYQWLANEAMRVLKRGGFVVSMAGNLYLNQIYSEFDAAGLTYFYNVFFDSGSSGHGVWIADNRADKSCRAVTPIKMLVCYCKGIGHLHSGMLVSTFRNSRKDKTYHHWGQSVASACFYIDYFSSPGDLVYDPFVGGGTTAVACELIGRRWIGSDVDIDALKISQQRLSDKDTAAYRNLPLFSRLPDNASNVSIEFDNEAVLHAKADNTQ